MPATTASGTVYGIADAKALDGMPGRLMSSPHSAARGLGADVGIRVLASGAGVTAVEMAERVLRAGVETACGDGIVAPLSDAAGEDLPPTLGVGVPADADGVFPPGMLATLPPAPGCAGDDSPDGTAEAPLPGTPG